VFLAKIKKNSQSYTYYTYYILLAFRGHFEGNGSINRGYYIELVNLLGKYNTTLGNHLESSTVFSGLSNNIQNDLINSISIILINEIKTEIKSCKLKIFLNY